MTNPDVDLSRLGIGKVIEELRPEFPEITITKIRYLESEGLVEPERTASGYRKFSYADVERLRFILTQQRDKFWPLSHIRQVLEDMDKGVVPPDEVGGAVAVPHLRLAEDGMPDAEAFREGRSRIRLSQAEILESAKITPDLLEAIEQYGLINRRTAQSFYDGNDLTIASVVAEFARLGLEPRHLKIFRTAADREIGLFEQILSPAARQQDKDRAAELTAAIAALSVKLHTVLVRVGLNG